MKKILITGAAGFIGFHVTKTLLAQEWQVIGLDNLNDYYDVQLKKSRLGLLSLHPGFEFIQSDLADNRHFSSDMRHHTDVTHVLHLAAQAGVRYSLENPHAYIESNVMGQLNVLEYCRNLAHLQHLVYASSSSVYGSNSKVPFAVGDRVDHPVSLYAVTKRTDELMTKTYSQLYKIPATGLRFFTVYGPYGRPDMAYFTFTRDILAGNPITLFNQGRMRRDFTYIDDVVQGTIAALGAPPKATSKKAAHRLFNLGNHQPVHLRDFVAEIEKATGREAKIDYAPMQPGDVEETYADIENSKKELQFEPHTTIAEGIPRFVRWYQEYYKV